MSLGSIIGGAVSGIEPHYTSMLLNVGGAGLIDIFQHSEPMKRLAEDKGIVPGAVAHRRFLSPCNGSSTKWMASTWPGSPHASHFTTKFGTQGRRRSLRRSD